MKNNNNSGWIWALVVIVIIIAIAIGVHMHKEKVAMQASTDASTSNYDTSGAITPTEDISAGSVDAPTTATSTPVTVSYANALIQYANSRFQFDNSCAATPNAATFAKGTKIMLDNRSANPLTIQMGSLGSFAVKPYGFKIVQLALSGLTANAIAVDCNAQQNVAIITVQE